MGKDLRHIEVRGVSLVGTGLSSGQSTSRQEGSVTVLEARDMETLSAWHERLARRFTLLRACRPVEWPIFALEHGLTPEERELLFRRVRSRIHWWGLPTHRGEWLPFVVYATELGYPFDGDEYWTSFEEKTP